MNNFVLRTISGAVFAGLVIGLVWWNQWSLLGLVLFIGSIGVVEYGNLSNLKSPGDRIRLVTLNLLTTLAVAHISADSTNHHILATALGLLALITILTSLRQHKLQAADQLQKLFFGILYISVPLGLFYQWALDTNMEAEYNFLRPLMVFLLVWSSDTFAYLTGRAVGKTPLAPTLSPKKTVEGLAGGTILTAILGAYLCTVWAIAPAVYGAVLGILVSLLGTAEGLFQSSMKRRADVKDSGNLIPGHGGVLDRFDAFLFAALLVWIWQQLIDFVY